MRLSEAIRLGAMLKPQGRGRFYQNGHTCALGAALDAVGALDTSSRSDYDAVESRWPVLTAYVAHPNDAAYRLPLWLAIEDANDCRHWTREQIAEWVETIEREQEQTQPATAAVLTTA